MKKTVKKLVLSKETVRDLSQRELRAADGGSGFTWQNSIKWCDNQPASKEGNC